MDVKNAFLHDELQEEVYMEQPQRFEDVRHPSYVCQLKKALYGMMQSPRFWHAQISSYFLSIGFCMDDVDHFLYMQKNDTSIVIVCICVDDLIIECDNLEHNQRPFKKELDMKDLSEPCSFLDIEIIRTKDGIWLSQRQCALDMLRE